MANTIQLSLPPILERQKDHLMTHFANPLQEYYGDSDRMFRIQTVYRDTVRETSPIPTVSGAILSIGISWIVGCKKQDIICNGMFGGAGSAFVNSIYQIPKIRADIREDEEYKAWKESIYSPVLQDFREIISTDDRFKNFMCTITQKFPAIPVRDSSGRLYDQEAIFKWIGEKGTNPVTEERMAKYDVTFCPNFAPDLKALVEEVFGHPDFMSFIKGSDDEIIKGLKNLLRSSIVNYNTIVYATAIREMDAVLAVGLPSKEANDRYQEVYQKIMNVPEARKPLGFAAIMFAESIDDLSDVVSTASFMRFLKMLR